MLRFCNIDYVFLSAILGITLHFITLSYDIACQWKKNFWQRMESAPSHLRLDPSRVIIQSGLPLMHAERHIKRCRDENSLKLQPGVGATDGEGIERFWSNLNRIAVSTKEMGVGNRSDTLDDYMGHHNWEKNVKMGTFFVYVTVLSLIF
jgi:hypothetical protein